MAVSRAIAAGNRRFREEREADWAALAELLDRAEKKSLKALTDDELVALPVLYRATLSALSVARATSLDADLIAYLESLSARAYFFVYGVGEGAGARARRFFRHDWPAAMRRLAGETLVSLALLIAGTLVGALLVTRDPSWYGTFVPRELAAGRDPAATTAALRATLYAGAGNEPLAVLASFLFTHNAGVAIFAFALGFAAGVPTALLILSTGCMLGAFLALFAGHGLLLPLLGWLMIHGTTELFAVVLAGAAGFHVGRAVIFPGVDARVVALQAAGQRAGTAMVGVGIMLFVAGLLEGFARQLITSDWLRFTVAGVMLAGWLGYFYLPPAAPRSDRHGG
ncbi:hypothetical protein IP88_13050 [alpha proteobacterium AAP81b]|nr:hypothetical protein IP88_13050 [alpha proteobacterium AAP81b]